MTLKNKVYNHYKQELQNKINMLQKVLADLKESGANETKSTAGDKHETALAMLQIEQANSRTQLEGAYLQKKNLEKINPSIAATWVVPGSLIKTSRGYLFLSLSMGKATLDGITVTTLSPQSPLGIKLMGLKKGDTAEVNNNTFFIESIE